MERIKLWFRLFEWGHHGIKQNCVSRVCERGQMGGLFSFSHLYTFWLDKLSNIRDTDKNKNCFASIVCIRKILLYLCLGILCLKAIDCSENWYKNLLMSTSREFYLFWTFFDLELYFGKRFICFFFFFGWIYVERKWVGFVKHLRRNFPRFFFLLSSNSSSSFYYYHSIIYGRIQNILVGCIDERNVFTNHWAVNAVHMSTWISSRLLSAEITQRL